jgi:sulfotransferase family protein
MTPSARNSQKVEHPLLLLMGLPRSGTTWIAKMFDSHPGTVYCHEADRGVILRSMPLAPDISEAEALSAIAQAFVDNLLKIRDPHVVGSQPQFRKDYRKGIAAGLYQLSTISAKAASAVGWKWPIFPMVNYDNVRNLRVIWKSVISIGRVGVFVRALRNRHAIVLLRHPCGHVASMLRGESEHRFPFPPSEDYRLFEILLNTRPARERKLTVDYLTSIRPAERLAWRWVIMYEKALQDIQGIDGCMSIRYEDVCAQPVKHARQMFEFCGLPWVSSTTDFLKSSTATEKKKYYAVFKNPLKSAMRWQSDLSEDDIDRIYRVVQQSNLGKLYPRGERLGEQTDQTAAPAGRL